MTFYSRYEQLCNKNGYDPCSQTIADLIGTTKATISTWKKRNSTPKGDTLYAIANVFGVSSDYLIGRTDDPTDYSNPDLVAQEAGAAMDALDGDVKATMDFHKAVDNDAMQEITESSNVLSRYQQLDLIDKAKAEAYIDGLLAADKYRRKLQA